MYDRVGRESETLRHSGLLYLTWECPVCGHQVERILSGRPWYCPECGYLNRMVEAEAEDIHEADP